MATSKILNTAIKDIETGFSTGVPNEYQFSFERQHATAPRIVIAESTYNLGPRIVSPYNITASGFNVGVYTLSGAESSTWVSWIAIW